MTSLLTLAEAVVVVRAVLRVAGAVGAACLMCLPRRGRDFSFGPREGWCEFCRSVVARGAAGCPFA